MEEGKVKGITRRQITRYWARNAAKWMIFK
jgi:hypothetical protein